jgi:hypothetical protein
MTPELAMSATHERKPVGPLAAALLLAATLAACSSVVDTIPTSVGGLPEGVPARPAVAPAYPAVHDLPPSRRDGALNEADSKRLREELKNTRARVAPAEATTGSAGTTGSARNP